MDRRYRLPHLVGSHQAQTILVPLNNGQSDTRALQPQIGCGALAGYSSDTYPFQMRAARWLQASYPIFPFVIMNPQWLRSLRSLAAPHSRSNCRSLSRLLRRYGRRLRELVRSTGDIQHGIDRSVPRSTARGWLKSPKTEVVAFAVSDMAGRFASALREISHNLD